MTEYPSIERQIRRVRLAAKGSKRAHQRRLVRLRLALMKRELTRMGAR